MQDKFSEGENYSLYNPDDLVFIQQRQNLQ